jgi:hypothetical protein
MKLNMHNRNWVELSWWIILISRYLFWNLRRWQKIGTEIWDDGNISNGDGWSFNCLAIEIRLDLHGRFSNNSLTFAQKFEEIMRYNSLSTCDDGNLLPQEMAEAPLAT